MRPIEQTDNGPDSAQAPPDMSPASARRRGRAVLLAVALTYISLGAVLGFVQGGIAPVLRAQGLDLSSMRWLYALYLPFGIAFMWASRVDAWRWPWLGRRSGWIVTMQWVAVAAAIAIACIPPQAGNWRLLMLLGFVATLAAATMDVALDALTVDTIPDESRAAAAAAKMGGISLGSVLGGGVLVALYPLIAWKGAMLAIAGMIALSGLPIFAVLSMERACRIQAPRRGAGLRQALGRPGMGNRLLRLTLLACTLLALFNFNRLMLVDMGVSLARIGSVLGTAAPIVNALACLGAPRLLRLLPMRGAAWVFAALCLASASLVWLGFVLASPAIVMAGSVMTTAGASALYVVLGSLILAWANGRQAATDYALLYGLGRFMGTAALMILPGMIPTIGWPAFQAATVIAFALCAWYFLRLIPRTPASAGHKPPAINYD